MFALLLQGGGQGQEFFPGDTRGGEDVGDLGLALGDGAGLVQGHDLGAAGGLQRGGGLEEDAVFGAHSVAHHDGHRGGQAQGAGTADDQHRDAPGQGKGQILAQQEPDQGGHHRNGDDRRDKDARHPVSDLGDGGLGGGGVADHPNDLGQGGILAHPGGLAPQKARLVDGGGRDGVAGGLVHRDALAGEGALVDGAGALQHHPVHRDVFAGPDHKLIPPADLLDGHRDLFALPQEGGGLGGQLHQALEGAGGLALAAGFQHLAHRDEGEDHGRRLKVQLHHIIHHPGGIAVDLGVGHLKDRVGAPDKGGGGPQGHQGVHVGGAVQQALETADEKLLVDDHDDAGQQQLNQGHCDVIPVEPGRQGPAPHHVSHREIHQDHQKSQRRNQPPPELGGLVVGQGVQGCIGRRGRGGPGLFGAGAVARLLDRLNDGGGGGGTLHPHGIGQQAHRTGRDPRHLADRLFNPGAACRAAHPGDVVLFHDSSLGAAAYFISRWTTRTSSSTVSYLPASRSSTTQVRMCWPSSSLQKLSRALLTADAWYRMSGQ